RTKPGYASPEDAVCPTLGALNDQRRSSSHARIPNEPAAAMLHGFDQCSSHGACFSMTECNGTCVNHAAIPHSSSASGMKRCAYTACRATFRTTKASMAHTPRYHCAVTIKRAMAIDLAPLLSLTRARATISAACLMTSEG